MPVVLTIAGSDSGGEAGVQADLKTFNALRVHGVTALTCITAQNPRTISRLEPVSPTMVRAQLDAIAAHFPIKAAKTGMLYSVAIIREVTRFLKNNPGIPVIVDPVMVSTSGRRLLHKDAIKILKEELLPLAVVVTPNLAEAEILTGIKIRSLPELREAAAMIYRTFGCGALVKGGHLIESAGAIDFFHGPQGEWMLNSPRRAGVALHGTGCTYSAAAAAWLGRGKSPFQSIKLAKDYITLRIYETRSP